MQVCGICGGNHCPMECDIVQVASHIPDNRIPSKAKSTLPEDLELRKMADNSYNVITNFPITKGTQFGPLQARKICSLLPTISFPLRIFCKAEDNVSEYYLDTSNENECNWMMFVNPASDFQEQNVICYQDGEDIYYVTVKDLCEGEALKVWYSPYYATKMQKDVLKPVVNEQNKVTSHDNNYIDVLVRNKKNITSREIWSCKFCGKMERNLSEFTLHLLQHYRTKLKRYCQICNVSFIKVQGYQKHMKIVHETDVTKAVQSELQSTSLQKSDKHSSESLPNDSYFGGPLLLNDLLSDSMDNTTLVLPPTYMNNMDLTSIENQNTLFENENLNLNMESILSENGKGLDNFNFELMESESEQYVCDICLKAFRKLKAMMVHMNIHSGKYTCFDCNKVFARRENLNYHPCKVFYRFKCPSCAKLFFQKKYLMRHIKTAHCNPKKPPPPSNTTNTKQALIKCAECPRTFTKKNNLLTHSKSHQKAGEKFTCPICNKVLSSQKTYFKHYKLHEGHLYKCDICEKVFNRKDTLKYHRDHIHFPNVEVCAICKKVVKSKKLLKVHMKLHEDKTYKCSQCPSIFKHHQNLSRHVKSIHGINRGIQSFLSNIDKLYSCPKCDKKLKLSRSVKRHIESAHPDYIIDYKTPKLNKNDTKKQINLSKQVEDSVLDLKQTIENMNFATDEINHEITIEIDKLLNNPENFGSESNDRLVESLISSAVRENNLENKNQQKDIMLSMPDLDIDDDL